MKKRLVLYLGLLGSIAIHTSDKAGIFVDRPDLTWKKFEQEFRKQYPNANIPAIKDVADMPQFIWHKEAEQWVDVHAHMAHTPAAYIRQDKLLVTNLDLSTRAKYSSGTMRTLLLHETGHHMYPEDSKKTNLQKAMQVFSEYQDLGERLDKRLDDVSPIVTGGAKVVTGCSILRYGPNAKLLCGLFVIQNAQYVFGPMLGFYAQNRAEFTRVRGEEIAADRYAFERASVEDLKAFDKDFLSFNGSLNTQKAFLDMKLEKLPVSSWSKYRLLAARKFDQLCQILRYKSSIIHDIFDPAHPCDRDRRAAIAVELQRRGEK